MTYFVQIMDVNSSFIWDQQRKILTIFRPQLVRQENLIYCNLVKDITSHLSFALTAWRRLQSNLSIALIRLNMLLAVEGMPAAGTSNVKKFLSGIFQRRKRHKGFQCKNSSEEDINLFFHNEVDTAKAEWPELAQISAIPICCRLLFSFCYSKVEFSLHGAGVVN
jgi:hypothetical protein